MKQKKKLLPWQFKLSDCKAEINLIENSKDKGYGTAFLNITFPDGRWIAFKSSDAMRVPMYAEAPVENNPKEGQKE